MVSVRVSLVGTLPMLVNSQQVMDRSLNKARELKLLTSKRGKTDEDMDRIADLDMELRVYWDHKRDVAVMPAFNIIRSFQDGGKKLKCGKKIIQGIRIHPEYQEPEIIYSPKLSFKEFCASPAHRDTRTVTVNGTVERTRPRFDEWGIDFVLLMDDEILVIDELNECIRNGGLYYGLGDFRVGTKKGGRYGTYQGVAEILNQ